MFKKIIGFLSILLCLAAVTVEGAIPAPGIVVNDLIANGSIPTIQAPAGVMGGVVAMTIDQLSDAYLTFLRRQDGAWFGSGFQWKNRAQWLALMPRELQTDIRKKYWGENDEFIDMPENLRRLEGLMPVGIGYLAQRGRLPWVAGMGAMNMCVLARVMVHDHLKELVKAWNSKDKNAQSVEWLTLMPRAFYQEVQRYFRCAMIRFMKSAWVRNWNYWLDGQVVTIPVTYLMETGVLPVPNGMAFGAFNALADAGKANAYVRDIQNIMAGAGGIEEKVSQISEILRYVPKNFVALIAERYAIATGCLTGSLFEEPDIFGDVSWSVTLDDLLGNAQFLNTLDQQAATGKLELSDMHLREVSLVALQLLPNRVNVREFTVSDKQLERLPVDVLQAFPNLEKIVITKTNVETLPAGLFTQNQRLKNIVIVDNKKLTNLPTDLFAGCAALHLDVVDMSRNALTSEGLPFFGNLQVRQLFLAENKLTTISPANVRGGYEVIGGRAREMTSLGDSLQALYLRKNTLSFARDGGELTDDLRALPQLKYLDLSYNEIGSLRPILQCQMPHLEVLLLTGNKKITQVCDVPLPVAVLPTQPPAVVPVVYELASLKMLDLSDCSIAQLKQGDFRYFKYLEWLSLEKNDIKALGESNGTPNYFGSPLSDLRKLKALYLDGNALVAVNSDSFKALMSLEVLHLEGNKIVTIGSGSFAELNSLKELYLFCNNHYFSWNATASGLSTVIEANAFRGLAALEVLDLSFNNIPVLVADMFAGMSRLQVLNLSHNALHEVPARVFSGMGSLRVLDLSGNSIGKFSCVSWEGTGPELKTINLRGNNGFGILSPKTSIALWYYRWVPWLWTKGWTRIQLDWTQDWLYGGDIRRVCIALFWSRLYDSFVRNIGERLCDELKQLHASLCFEHWKDYQTRLREFHKANALRASRVTETRA